VTVLYYPEKQRRRGEKGKGADFFSGIVVGGGGSEFALDIPLTELRLIEGMTSFRN